MTLPNMLNTFMQTAYHLLLETVFYIMAICVLMGAIGKLLIEFGVVRLLENILRPLMKPLYNLPGVAALGAVMTFLSDNPAIISLAHDKNFSQYFKKYQLVSLTNFGTAFGMGLVVLAFMIGKGFGSKGALVGIAGAFIGSIVSTRLMQRFTLKSYPEMDFPVTDYQGDEQQISYKSEGSVFQRFLNSLLDGGKEGVNIGFAIIPGVLCISTIVMMLTFGPDSATGAYTGAAYEGVPIITMAGRQNQRGLLLALRLREWCFGVIPHHRLGCRGCCHRSCPPLHHRRHHQQQRHRRLHRHGHVLERLPLHPHRHARQPRLPQPHRQSHRCPHHRRPLRRHRRPLALCPTSTNILITKILPSVNKNILHKSILIQFLFVFLQNIYNPKNVNKMAYKITDICVACGTCIDQCPVGAISEGDIYKIDPDTCVSCGTCADACPTGAIVEG